MFSILKKIFGQTSEKNIQDRKDLGDHENHKYHKNHETPEDPETSRDEIRPESRADRQSVDIPSKDTVRTADPVREPSIASNAPARRRPKPRRRQKKAAGRSSRQRRPSPARNRHGIPVFRNNSDISMLFENRPVNDLGDGEYPPRAAIQTPPAPAKPPVRSRNKNGIPVFDETADFSHYFKEPLSNRSLFSKGKTRENDALVHLSDDSGNSDDFHELMEASLSGKTMEILLREKRDHPESQRPSTVNRIIQRYPPPQEELDLHGHTAREAVVRTRAFVERSRYRGKRTLLIIVGKGLHSEGKAILPDVVETELARLGQERKILAHRWERGAKRKSGAIVVYLNPL